MGDSKKEIDSDINSDSPTSSMFFYKTVNICGKTKNQIFFGTQEMGLAEGKVKPHRN